jgi:hypothetical protein
VCQAGCHGPLESAPPLEPLVFSLMVGLYKGGFARVWWFCWLGRVRQHGVCHEVNLQFLARLALDPPGTLGLAGYKSVDKAPHRVLTPLKAMARAQALPDALRSQSGLNRRLNDVPPRLATTPRAGGHFGGGGSALWRLRPHRPGGRFVGRSGALLSY